MQQSMTGYGIDERISGKYLIKTEIKTLNSKFFDLSLRCGKEFFSGELAIRNKISDRLKRGKILLKIDLLPTEVCETEVRVNDSLFKAYYNKFLALSKGIVEQPTTTRLFELALSVPEVLHQQELNIDEVPWNHIFDSIEVALNKCVKYRQNEGQALVVKLKEYIRQIELELETIKQAEENRLQYIRSRLQKNLDEIRERVHVDENRFEQELIYYLEKIDITEEKVRLSSHLQYFKQALQHEDSCGKKLGFLTQEIGREINTLGSKANDANIQKTVVKMKEELEKIKEQVLNIL